MHLRTRVAHLLGTTNNSGQGTRAKRNKDLVLSSSSPAIDKLGQRQVLVAGNRLSYGQIVRRSMRKTPITLGSNKTVQVGIGD
jgi:hypothetical protein